MDNHGGEPEKWPALEGSLYKPSPSVTHSASFPVNTFFSAYFRFNTLTVWYDPLTLPQDILSFDHHNHLLTKSQFLIFYFIKNHNIYNMNSISSLLVLLVASTLVMSKNIYRRQDLSGAPECGQTCLITAATTPSLTNGCGFVSMLDLFNLSLHSTFSFFSETHLWNSFRPSFLISMHDQLNRPTSSVFAMPPNFNNQSKVVSSLVAKPTINLPCWSGVNRYSNPNPQSRPTQLNSYSNKPLSFLLYACDCHSDLPWYEPLTEQCWRVWGMFDFLSSMNTQKHKKPMVLIISLFQNLGTRYIFYLKIR